MINDSFLSEDPLAPKCVRDSVNKGLKTAECSLCQICLVVSCEIFFLLCVCTLAHSRLENTAGMRFKTRRMHDGPLPEWWSVRAKWGSPARTPQTESPLCSGMPGWGRSARRLTKSPAWPCIRLPCVRSQRKPAARPSPASWCTCWSWLGVL